MPKELSGSRDGEQRRSDQASEGCPASKKPRIDFATRPYQLHEQQQSQATIEEQLHILEEHSYIMHKQIQSIKEQYQAGSSNLMTRDFLTPLNQNQAHQTHLEIGNAIVDDFDDWFSQHHESCDQTKASSQSLPETRQPFDAHHPTEAQRIEQRQDTSVQQHKGYDQTGPSHHADAQYESTSEQERTWTTQQLYQLVDDMVRIKDFDHKIFQDALSEESNAICEQLNKYGRSFNYQEWEDVRTRFQMHNVTRKDKRRRYLCTRTENSRNLQKQRVIRANIKAKKEGFKDRSRKQRSNNAPEPS